MNGKSIFVGLTLVVGTFCSAPSIAASQKPYQVAETQTELYIRVQKEMADEARADADRTQADKTPAQLDATNSDQRTQDVTGTVGMARTRKSDLRANPDASR